MIVNAVDNILAMSYGKDGINWYQEANEYASNLAALYNTSLDKVAGMIAALSPQNKWDTNKLDCANLLEAYQTGQDVYDVKVSTFNLNKAKAVYIMFGDNPLEVIKGNKTRSFFRNIVNPLDSNFVTIDRHAVSIALGKRVTNPNDISYYVRTNKRYLQMVEYYKLAARELNLLPCQVQSISWVNYRNTHNIN